MYVSYRSVSLFLKRKNRRSPALKVPPPDNIVGTVLYTGNITPAAADTTLSVIGGTMPYCEYRVYKTTRYGSICMTANIATAHIDNAIGWWDVYETTATDVTAARGRANNCANESEQLVFFF